MTSNEQLSQAPQSTSYSSFSNEISGRDFGKIENRVEHLEKDVQSLQADVSKLKEQRSWVLGAAAVIGILVTVLADKIIDAIFKAT